MARVQVVSVKFGVDKRAGDSFAAYYGARSKNTKTYDYIWMRPDWLHINVGEEVVIKTPTHGMTVATVVDVKDYERVEDTDAAWSLKPVYAVVREDLVSKDYRIMQDNTIYYNEKLAERRKAERAQRAAEELERAAARRAEIQRQTEVEMERQRIYAEKVRIERMKREAEAVMEERKKKALEELVAQQLIESDSVFRELNNSVVALDLEWRRLEEAYNKLG